ncbi:hypothetical protein PCANC_11091 [Puccinia coronata f. sp. avenae]|uniref:Peptide hydrolase n=1 Tax=Puccinia coronata f. sp. avenae TaxID=200324 RepID=A0A2N5UW31_9BASI|nr:hypothetical protein PCASD_13154 [Puccinia coronata f. sp. avenae]PLW41968.1 hypothetical protein PCANC_11091 [Puccinia coronata f. sp. avenae]
MKPTQKPKRLPKSVQTNSFTSLLSILLTFLLISAISTYLRYALPTPKGLPTRTGLLRMRNQTGAATSRQEVLVDDQEFSETLANEYIDHLAGTIGYRIVGTEEMAESLEYLNHVLRDLKTQAEQLGSNKQFEILTQVDDGAHLFEFIGKKVWKKYFQLSNVIVRLSDPSIPSSRENAVLVNAHLDSTLPSPGAADDVAGVAVMLEAIRIITQSPDWPMHNGIVFLFNGAEESLQDASHMFITKHPLKDIVRAVINLEACGTAGQEILFQATSTEMIEAYSKVPRPFGSVIASEVFRTGLIASDTDFRQFVQYGNLTGLDMAIMQNSYLYHSSQDIPSKIEPGAVQHMGENTMALLKHLTSSAADLTHIKPASTTVFFSGLGGLIFIMYSKTKALRVYTSLFVAGMTLITRNVKSKHYSIYFFGFLAAIGSLLGFVIGSNVVAFIMSIVLGKPLSWYRYESFPILLFGPPALAGGLSVQYLFSKLTHKSNRLRSGNDDHVLSHATLSGLIALNGITSVLGAYFNIGAAYLPAIGLVSMLLSLMINDFILAPITGKRGHLHLPMYLAALVLPGFLGVEGLLAFLDLFVPMTGRMGHEVHVDFMIASLVSAVGFNIVSISLPLAHRFSRRALGQFLVGLLMFSSLVGFWFTRPEWNIFDSDHPKRLPILHMENLTSSSPSFDLHIASMDRAPGFENLVQHLMDTLSLSHQSPILSAINDDIPDWDIIYPVSQFLKSYQVPLGLIEQQSLAAGHDGDVGTKNEYLSPWTDKFKITSLESKLDFINQQRTIVLAIDHPGIIWTVIAFTADVVHWDLPSRAVRGKRRHHVKEASGFGVDRWTLNVTIALEEAEFQSAVENEQILKGQRVPIAADDQQGQAFARLGKLKVEFSGIDQLGLYPARSKPKRLTYRPSEPLPNPDQNTHLGWIGKGNGGPGLRLFDKLYPLLPDWVDPFLLSAVSNTGFI